MEVRGVLYSNPFTNVRRNLEIISRIRGAGKQNKKLTDFCPKRQMGMASSEKTKKI